MFSLQLNELLESAGLDLATTRPMRHQQVLEGGLTPFYLWKDHARDFHFYQSTQNFDKRATLKSSRHWISFVVSPDGKTLFVGVYSSIYKGVLDYDVDFTSDRTRKISGSCDEYETQITGILQEFRGRLLIDWGPGARRWIQYPGRRPKVISGLLEKGYLDTFPGYLRFKSKLSALPGLPNDWHTSLRAARGVYLLTSAADKKQYVGSAYGANGFLGRWMTHLSVGGDAVRLQANANQEYQVSILEVAGSSMNKDDIIAAEMLWIEKLQSRAMGLN